MAEENGRSAGFASFMRRGDIFLEDEEWDQANAYFEKVLDIDPEYGPAYAGKLCAEFHACTQAALTEASKPLDTSKNYKNALRFGDDALKAELTALNTEVHNALTYRQAGRLYQEKHYEDAAVLFQKIAGYRDAAAMAEKCGQLGGAKSDRQKRALEMMRKISSYEGNLIINNPDGTLSFGVRSGNLPDTLQRIDEMSRWKNIVAIDGLSGLKADGTVVSVERRDVSKWTDIIAISGSAGLKTDGTVVSDDRDLNRIVSKWESITAISGWKNYVAGLKADGSVVVARLNIPGGCRFGSAPQFTDAVAVKMTEWHLVVLRADGTVWAGDFQARGKGLLSPLLGREHENAAITAKEKDGTPVFTFRADVSGWRDIIAIGGLRNVIFGIKSDGTIVMSDSSGYHAGKLKPQVACMQNALAAEVSYTGVEDILFSISGSGLPQIHNDYASKYQLQTSKYFENLRNLRAERARKGLCIYCGGQLTGLFTKKCKACGKDNDGGLLDQLDSKLGNR